jgi:hypothetical protein
LSSWRSYQSSTQSSRIHLFDGDGRLVRAEIDPLRRAALPTPAHDLGQATFGRIVVEPFEVKRFGQTFRLVIDEPDTSDEIWWVTVEPGNCYPNGAMHQRPHRPTSDLQIQRPRPNIDRPTYQATTSLNVLAGPP